MPFAGLPPREKDAFFSLLDEYFASRPEIFGGGGGGGQGHGQQDPVQEATSHAASAMKKAMVKNPEATAKVFSAGLRHAASASSTPPKRGSPGLGGGSNADKEEGESVQTSVANRIAAFSAGRNKTPPVSSGGNTNSAPSLASTRRFGDVDTSSAKGFISSLRGSGSNNNSNNAPVPPPTYAPPSSSYAPPPSRRFGAGSVNEDSTPPPAPPAPPPPPPTRGAAAHQQEEEEEERGEWAEALYDYDSAEPGDLRIREGQRILVTERSSDDWWTGEIDGNGKSGLFPASYAKLL